MGVATKVAKVRTSGHWRTSPSLNQFFSDVYISAVCARSLPLPRQSLQPIPCFLACIFSTALSSLLHFCLLSFLWSSLKEWQNILIPSWWYQHFLLWLCFLFFPSAPYCSLQTIEMKSISAVPSSMKSCSWLSCLKILCISKSQCHLRAEIPALAHVCIWMTSKIAAITNEQKFSFIFPML